MKQTRKDSLIWLLTPLCIAILCVLARRWQLSTAFEGEFRLPISAAPAAIVLIALWVLAAAVFILLGLKTPVDPVMREHSELALSARQDHLVLGGILFGWCSATEPQLMDMYPYTPNTYYVNYEPYGTDRNNLYNVLIDRLNTYIIPNETFAVIIHTGTTFENALSSYMTEFDLHRDYTHGTDYTRLMVAYVWYCRLMGIDQLEDIKQDTIPVKWFRSNTGLKDVVLTETEKNILIESVNNSLKNPYEITQSQYTEAPAK